MLLDEFACNVNTRRSDGSTLLIDACNKSASTSEDLLACVRILCERGADLYAVDDDGDGALYYANDEALTVSPSACSCCASSECVDARSQQCIRARLGSLVLRSCCRLGCVRS